MIYPYKNHGKIDIFLKCRGNFFLMKIVKKKTGKNTALYYYLQHSARINGKIKKFEQYLGNTIPENMDEIENNLFNEIRIEKYGQKLNQIRIKHVKHEKELPKSSLEKEKNIFNVEFTFNTQKIEGSTLSLQETALLLENNTTPSNKPIEDVIEARNHNLLLQKIMAKHQNITFETMLQWHKELFSQTKGDIAGQIRTHGVKITGSSFVPPSPVELSLLVDEFFTWYAENSTKIHPVELAGLTHLKLVTIHPFADGNGRISRLLMNTILYQQKFPMIDIKYQHRLQYYKALEKSQVSEKDHYFLDWFLSYYCKYS